MATRIPAPPEAVPRGAAPLSADAWEALVGRLEANKTRSQAANEHGNEIKRETRLATLHLQLGEVDAATAAMRRARAILDAVPADVGVDAATGRRAWGLVHCAEALVTLETTLHFLGHGAFPPLPEGGADRDGEYVAGLLGAAEELARYATRRATAGDAASVAVCRDGVRGLQAALLEFDFRNGPLRRKFDGLKYQVRRLEDILYEQSLVGRTVDDYADGESAAAASLADIKVRFDAADAARELVIKKSRDVQKGAKQAIFACHRGDVAKAQALIAKAAADATAILEAPDLVVAWPWLRQGSLAAALEEYAEAALFAKWLADGSVAGPGDLGLPLTDEEYLGGVCDLTGEVGRVAVQAATKRDAALVTRVYATDLGVLEQLTRLPLPPKLAKKLDPLYTAVRKVEALLYDLALAAANPAGKRPLSSGSEPPPKREKSEDETEE